MEIIHTLIDLIKSAIGIILHMDVHLNEWIGMFGPGIYGILFLIIFCETGLVVTPFLPGDSLLFTLGALTAVENPQLNIWILTLTLLPAAILGDAVNYAIGRYCGDWLLQSPLKRFIKDDHLRRTQAFYDKHGGKTIILARYIPIVRTFAPFVAGIGKMEYSRFFFFNVVGAFTWIPVFLWLGRMFGNLPVVKDQFHLVIVGIIFVSFLPVLIEWWKARQEARTTAGTN